MKNLNITKTTLTPQISFQANGELLIKGISTPEDVSEFYKPVFDWLNDFKHQNPPEVNLVLEMDYVNTSSSKIMVQLLLLVNSMKNENSRVLITWRYEDGDDDMLELGKDFQLSSQSQMIFVGINKN